MSLRPINDWWPADGSANNTYLWWSAHGKKTNKGFLSNKLKGLNFFPALFRLAFVVLSLLLFFSRSLLLTITNKVAECLQRESLPLFKSSSIGVGYWIKLAPQKLHQQSTHKHIRHINSNLFNPQHQSCHFVEAEQEDEALVEEVAGVVPVVGLDVEEEEGAEECAMKVHLIML